MIKVISNERKHLILKLLIAFGPFLVLAIAFAAVASVVREGNTLGFDRAVLEWMYGLSSPFLDTFFLAMTTIGGPTFIAIATLLSLIFLLYKKKRNIALFLTVGIGGTVAINTVLKLLFARTRPDLWEQLVTESSFSFPSGHAMTSITIACCVVFLVWRTKWRQIAMGISILYVLVVGLSRLYLGVHYPTDVLGGWLMGLLWMLLVVRIYQRHRTTFGSSSVPASIPSSGE